LAKNVWLVERLTASLQTWGDAWCFSAFAPWRLCAFAPWRETPFSALSAPLREKRFFYY